MNWEDLRYLLALSRAGTLSGAAAELGVVRTTVGRRLDALEAALGVRLFERTPDGLVVTGAGQDLTEVASTMEAEVLSAEGRVLGRDADLSGKLRVSTLDFLYQAYVDVFSSFTQRYPNIQLTVCASYEQVSLRRREADVALRLTKAPAEHLVGRRLGRVEFAVYASRALAERMGKRAALSEYPWLREDERNEDRVLDRWLSEQAPGYRVAMRFDSYPVLRAAVTHGVGVHLLPCLDAERDPDLVRVGPYFTEEARQLWVLTLDELRTNSRVRAFMDHAAASLAGRS